MTYRIFISVFSVSIFFTVLILSQDVHSQLNNKPFSFKGSPDGGVGMSLGGKQAILNDEILNIRPKNILTAPNGQLLSIQEGPGNSAIVSFDGNTGFIPNYHGTSFRGSNEDMAVGVFNSFFSPAQGNSGFSAYHYQTLSGMNVNTWTERVVSGGLPVSLSPSGNSIDSWTAMVHMTY